MTISKANTHKCQLWLKQNRRIRVVYDSPMSSSYCFFPLFSFACLHHPLLLLLLHLHDLWVIWSKRWDAAFSRLFSSRLATWEAFLTSVLLSLLISRLGFSSIFHLEISYTLKPCCLWWMQSEVFSPWTHFICALYGPIEWEVSMSAGEVFTVIAIFVVMIGAHSVITCCAKTTFHNLLYSFLQHVSVFLFSLFLQVVETAVWVVTCTVPATTPSPM